MPSGREERELAWLDGAVCRRTRRGWSAGCEPRRSAGGRVLDSAPDRRLGTRDPGVHPVPAGYDAGLPIGITFIGGRWAEPKLVGLAYDYEQATKIRVPPQFIPTIGDALFPGVPNPPAPARTERQQATQAQRELAAFLR